MANQYSLVLIDEIDLLLHADAFRKLIEKLSEIATNINLQIIFTTHSLEMQYLSQYADIRYIEHQNGKMLVYDSIKPDLLYKMSGEMKHKYLIYVEDNFAASIVQQIALELSMQRHISIVPYGSIENAFAVVVGKVLSGEDTENVLIVMDGDRFVATEEKRKRLEAVLTGTEEGHDEKIQQALAMIVQFNLPANTTPEKYIHSLLISMDDSRECVVCAKNITMQHILEKYNSIYKVQMPKITPHVCRHTFCSNMAKSRMNPKTLQYIMGHSDISVTLNTYTHVNFEDAQSELQRVVGE